MRHGSSLPESLDVRLLSGVAHIQPAILTVIPGTIPLSIVGRLQSRQIIGLAFELQSATGGIMARDSGSASAPRPNPNEKLVRVFDTEQESETLVVRGLLESAGIDTYLSALDAPQDVLPVGGTIIRVREEDAERARQVIDEYRRAPTDDDTAEIELTEEPPSEA
jgi:hypothetical protein